MSVVAAALMWDMDGAELVEAVSLGRFPPHIADVGADGEWRIAAGPCPEGLLEMLDERACHLRGVSEEVALLTSEWHAHLIDMAEQAPLSAARPPDLGGIVSWCAVAEPCPLTATPAQFAWWCSHGVEDPIATAQRWEAVNAWYGMLWSAGIEHSNPTRGTQVIVAKPPKSAKGRDK